MENNDTVTSSFNNDHEYETIDEPLAQALTVDAFEVTESTTERFIVRNARPGMVTTGTAEVVISTYLVTELHDPKKLHKVTLNP